MSRRYITDEKMKEYFSLLEEKIGSFEPTINHLEVGTVVSIWDGVATVRNLNGCMLNEMLVFQNGVYGLAMSIQADTVGVVIFGQFNKIHEGDFVYRTEKLFQVPVGKRQLGRVIDVLGNPLDDEGPISTYEYLPISSPVPAVLDRQSVHEPLQTGILAIDSMVPIGKGQRELIIGDRKTGKTAIAIDTILNQADKNVVCIYVAIGQKESSISEIVQRLKNNDAMKYSIVVSCPSSEPSALQYMAPFAGCSIAEHFMHKGRDVLIIYDDLSKQAVAYREISLLLKRSPGREAYPGDIFYLHAKLLEHAAKLNDKLGGGSITALPIIETQYGDISSYIPTNVISITDGQIFLDADLFNSGQRPAINVGTSVSRVGGAAQIKAMKQVSASLRIDLAQYRELKVYTQFGSEIDIETQRKLKRGTILMKVLKQTNYAPMPVENQVVLLYAAQHGYFDDIPVNLIEQAKTMLIDFLKSENYHVILYHIVGVKELSKESESVLNEALEKFLVWFKESEGIQDPIDIKGK